jgi:hypothetical protein
VKVTVTDWGPPEDRVPGRLVHDTADGLGPGGVEEGPVTDRHLTPLPLQQGPGGAGLAFGRAHAPTRRAQRTENGCMVEIERERFEDMVGEALDGLPPDLGRLMRNVAVTVDHDAGPAGLPVHATPAIAACSVRA